MRLHNSLALGIMNSLFAMMHNKRVLKDYDNCMILLWSYYDLYRDTLSISNVPCPFFLEFTVGTYFMQWCHEKEKKKEKRWLCMRAVSRRGWSERYPTNAIL